MQFSSKSKRSVSIRITSLIDVMFLLLIFFMVTSTFLEQPGMKLELPSAQSAEINQTQRLVLFIDPDGRIILGDREVPVDSLEAAMAAAAAGSSDSTLVLKADRTVQHGTVIEVMDIAKRVGLKKLVVGTKQAGE